MREDSVKFYRGRCGLLAFLCAVLILGGGCTFKFLNQTSLDAGQIGAEKIQKVAVLVFDSDPLHMQAGMHISRLFETNLLQTGIYKIAERGEVERILRQKGILLSPAAPPFSLQPLADLLQVDGVILGSVSQYSRFDVAFTARLISVKSGLVLWSVSETGGHGFLPLSRVADRAVRSAVTDLQTKLR